MTIPERRKLLELVSRAIRYNILSDEDARQILIICNNAVDRAINEVEE